MSLRMGRLANIVLNVMSLVLVVAGLALVSTFFFGSPVPAPVAGGRTADAQNFDVPVLTKNAAPAKTGQHREEPAVRAPEDRTIRITVPKMARVRDAVVPYTTGDDEEALRNHVGIHLKGTGFPWEPGANVYIAGHRLGYPNTPSFLAFFDLNRLRKGDEIILTDSLGRRYVYRVFRVMVVDPTDIYVTRPVEGKSVVTLQTCTLPDYSQRLIVQAEKV
ncbi:hypothetical protein RxyAA322_04460 [Rubrobacter xylanophilus]|uniref:Peptidase C60, sortase A and B n=1 Tax=Rubrobacter xylanophilus TaxID=49319 RepID=A0A510HF58_9ACTN|nr:class E sortase [Rubrobacter xylanophilus]BBL78592.1 hypothetical protein RxyAA322_04460 [Rubrobacter xylanophilus]